MNYLENFPEDCLTLLAASLNEESYLPGESKKILKGFLDQNEDSFKRLNRPAFNRLTTLVSR